MNKLHVMAAALLLSASASMAQNKLEGGIKGGVTLTHGYTTVPPVALSPTISLPQLDNKSNGIGTGYSGGIWVRQNFSKLYVQVEVDYNRFVLKQKTDFAVPAGVAAVLAGLSLPSAVPPQTPANINFVSESVLESINVPILLGRRYGSLRVFGGPNLLFTRKAEAKRNTTATIATLSVSPPETTSDLLNLSSTANALEKELQVMKFTVAAEVGVGYTFLDRFDLDARYAVPVGGVYKDKNIKGFLGIGTVSLGIRLF